MLPESKLGKSVQLLSEVNKLVFYSRYILAQPIHSFLNRYPCGPLPYKPLNFMTAPVLAELTWLA